MPRRLLVPAVLTGLVLSGALGAAVLAQPRPDAPHNVVIFVADGLRYASVDADGAPALFAVRREGVDFRNSHSIYPTVTTPNASAIATGHRLGDTGDFGNSTYLGEPSVAGAKGSLVPSYENDLVLGGVNARFGGNYLNETSLLAAARAHGYATAAIGKLGPTAIQDIGDRDRSGAIVIDDSTGRPEGLPLAADLAAALATAGLPAIAPPRGANGNAGTSTRPGALATNREQQAWFTAVAAKVVLPRLKASNRPFVMVYWSRDPDGSQHNQGDSLNSLTPGINGPTSMAAIRNASDNLQALRDALAGLGLDKTTDILVTADHGFSTISKQSRTSPSAGRRYPDVPRGFMPPGFLAIDLSTLLNLPLYDPDASGAALGEGAHPAKGHAVLGPDPQHPVVAVGANGGSDLIWLPRPGARALARKIAGFLTRQDYTGAVFVDDALGSIPGTLPLSAIGLKGSALIPAPAIVVAFKSFSTGCPQPELCGVDIADTELQQGQGGHGAFGRADTRNFMAAAGPDFKSGYADLVPVSNADWVWTAAAILKLDIPAKGHAVGRVMSEALRGGKPVAWRMDTIRSAPAANGFVTVLNRQRVGATPYFDAAGAPGRTLGLRP